MLKVQTRKWRSKRRAGFGALAAFVCMLAAVGLFGQSPSKVDAAWESSDSRIVWPGPPDPARIEYVGAFTNTDTSGAKRKSRRLSRLLLGRKEPEWVKPVAVATNASGLVAVADPTIPTLNFSEGYNGKSWRLKRKFADDLQSPVGVAVDKKGKVYVADSVVGAIFVFDKGKNKKLLSTFGKGDLSRPTGVALSPSQDRLYVVDTIECRIVVFDLSGKKIDSFGERGSGPGQFNFPTYLATMPDGRICVSDSLNFRVQIFESDGTFVSMFGRAGDGAGHFARPKGIGVDSHGQIYVVDAAFENIQIFDVDGNLLLAFGESGTGPGQFSLPCGLFVDSSNNIWVADSFNQRVQVFHLLENGH